MLILGESGKASSHSLLAEWAGGFPKLETLLLGRLGLMGSLPDAWLEPGSFASLTFL
jgi:hypothetical protein